MSLYPDNPKSTKIDFQFRNKETDKIELIEIVNIMLDDKNTATDELIERLIHQKIRQKLFKRKLVIQISLILFPCYWVIGIR